MGGWPLDLFRLSMCVSLPGTNKSRYGRLNGGEAGSEPYLRTVSDAYRDAFQEGSLSA
ncbi:MAG: hypothetical protein ACFCVA_14075 [Gammaproteobacteria bacterium]